MEDYRKKYHKYKNKYIIAKTIKGGNPIYEISDMLYTGRFENLLDIKNKEQLKDKILVLQQKLDISNIDDILLMLNQKLNKLENLFYNSECKIYENENHINILKGLIKIFNLIADKQIDWVQSCNRGYSQLSTTIQNKKVGINRALLNDNLSDKEKDDLLKKIEDLEIFIKEQKYFGEFNDEFDDLAKLKQHVNLKKEK